MGLCSALEYPTLAGVAALEFWHWFGLAGFALIAWGFLEANSFTFELRAGEMVPGSNPAEANNEMQPTRESVRG